MLEKVKEILKEMNIEFKETEKQSSFTMMMTEIKMRIYGLSN